jgi:hypothetical protein
MVEEDQPPQSKSSKEDKKKPNKKAAASSHVEDIEKVMKESKITDRLVTNEDSDSEIRNMNGIGSSVA